MRGSEGKEILMPKSASCRLMANGVAKVIKSRTLSSENIYSMRSSKTKGMANPHNLSWRKRYALTAINAALAP
jgi:hypothetical protein